MGQVLYILLVIILSLAALFIAIIIVFRKSLIRKLNDSHPPEKLEFSDVQVVITPEPLKRTILLGAVLFVPQSVQVVMALPPHGNPELFNEGEHILYYRTTYRFYKYVDIRRRTNTFSVEDATTSDSYQISLEMKVSWEVEDAVIVAAVQEPVLDLINAIKDAIRRITIEYEHEQLIPTPGTATITNAVLVRRIYEELAIDYPQDMANKIISGIQLHTIIINRRKADPNRHKKPQPTESEINTRIIEETLQNRVRMANLELAIARHENQIEEERAALAHQIQKQTMKLESEREESRLELEREKVRIQARTAALTPVLQIFAHILSSPGSSRMIDSWSMNRMSRVFENIVASFWEDQNIVSAEYHSGPRSATNAREILTYQLVDLWKLEDYTEHSLSEIPNGNIGISVKLKKKDALLLYDIAGAEPKIIGIGLRNSTPSIPPIFPVKNLTIYLGLTIAEIVQKLEDKYGSKKKLGGFGTWI